MEETEAIRRRLLERADTPPAPDQPPPQATRREATTDPEDRSALQRSGVSTGGAEPQSK